LQAARIGLRKMDKQGTFQRFTLRQVRNFGFFPFVICCVNYRSCVHSSSHLSHHTATSPALCAISFDQANEARFNDVQTYDRSFFTSSERQQALNTLLCDDEELTTPEHRSLLPQLTEKGYASVYPLHDNKVGAIPLGAVNH
jgi:hypothetical protein